MSIPRVFIGSSRAHSNVARLVANRLESDGIAQVTIWDEGVFGLNHSILDRLLAVAAEFDFAVLIWAGDDLTQSKGETKPSPRDNVMFECGLFMGALGKDRVFIVCDQSIEMKIPSDFAGITLAYYDGSRIAAGEGISAVRAACDQIGEKITEKRFPEFVGTWRSRYPDAVDLAYKEVIDKVIIEAGPGGIIFKAIPLQKSEPCTAHGRIYNNQVSGVWRHSARPDFVEGLFMLIVNPMANAMYGYATSMDANGTMKFGTWVLVKETDAADDQVNQLMLWAETAMKNNTLFFPLPVPPNPTSGVRAAAAERES
jgi:hypothetical protein